MQLTIDADKNKKNFIYPPSNSFNDNLLTYFQRSIIAVKRKSQTINIT